MKLKYILFYWFPAISYAIVIFILSSMTIIPQPELFPNIDKAVHFLEYGIFCYLLTRALINKKNKHIELVYLAVIISILYALTDEIHQAYVPGRECSLTDWFFDLVGAFGYLIFFILKHKKPSVRIQL